MDFLPHVGDLVITHKPTANQLLRDRWVPAMDINDERVGIVRELRDSQTVYVRHAHCGVCTYYYHISWLEPFEEVAEADFDETSGDF